MAKGSLTWKKRSREIAKNEKRQEKIQRRVSRKEEKLNRPPSEFNEDPDLAGISPGPQPIPEI